MYKMDRDVADALARQYCEQPRLLLSGIDLPDAESERCAFRQAGVPVLELNDAPPELARPWLEAAQAFSSEYLMPVVVLGQAIRTARPDVLKTLRQQTDDQAPGCHPVTDADWLLARQVAITRAVERSELNQEFRRSRERRGWIRIGWQPETDLAVGNGLLLAWSSPLPLRRIRDFAARCPEVTLYASDAEALSSEVAAQGISVTGWRFAVK